MECVKQGETYPLETITLTFDITGALPSRQIRNASSGAVVEEFTVANGRVTITNPLTGAYTVSKWNVNLPPGLYVGEDKIQYPNGDIDVLWELKLTVS
jgi:hypothetical protein